MKSIMSYYLFQDRIKVKVDTPADLGEVKTINLPGCVIDMPILTDSDE